MIPSTTLKIDVVAPIASAIVSTAIALNPGFLKICFTPNAKSRRASSILSLFLIARSLLLIIVSISSRIVGTSPKRRSASKRASCGDIPCLSYLAARCSRWKRISSSASPRRPPSRVGRRKSLRGTG